ncbi:tetratricopeptide repeat protein [Phocaeicola coprocola]
MKNKTLIIIVIIAATAAALSLGIYQKRTHQINASLLQIEQLMYERPDSAWKILQHMPSISQLRKEEQALHALLFTQAQYKNYIPVKSDSLLRIAEAYYRTSSDSLHKAWTLFYLAQYYRDSDEKEKALSYFQQANIASRNIENNQFKFLLNLHWAGLLTNEDAYEKGIEKYQTANRYAILLKDTLKQINLYGKWGWCCLLKEEDERADSLFNVGLTLSATTKDRIYDKYLLNRLSLTARERKDYKRALELVNRSLSLAKDSTELYPLWNNKGEILLEMNQYDSAHFYLSKDTRDYDPYFKATHYLNWSIYEEKIKNLPKALEYSKRYAELLDTIYQKRLESKVVNLQHKYDYSLIQSENKLLKIKRQRLYISLTAICMAVLTVAVIFFYKRREEKRKLAEQMQSKDDLMKEMRLQLQEKTIDLHAAQEKIIEKETALDKELSQREKMRSEYSSKEAAMRKEILRHSEIIRKMEQLNKMSQQDKIQSRSVVLSDEEQDNLAEVINICYNNFTDRLWKKFPTLTKADISLCCLIKIGISNSNMLYLLETNKVALKKRKNRLKHDKMGMDENDSLDEFIMEF